jgi:Response regulator containing CheY-like receiver domain and AraC-type DNA-binding domain
MFGKQILYEQKFSISVNRPSDPLFYLFDYDERSYAINMEFQHFHSFYEIHILLEGNAAHIIEGDYFAISQYDMVFLKPARLHKTEYPEGSPKKRLIINFAFPKEIPGLEASLNRVLSLFEAPVPIYRFPENIRDQITDALNAIFAIGKNLTDIQSLNIHTRFIEFLCLAYGLRKHNSYHPEPPADSVAHKIYTITSFIHSNYRERLSLEQISERFFISPYYLSHQFRNTTGFTLVNYIQMTRVRNAQQLLLYTDMKVSDIAEECGFNSFSQFNRVFNKFCGMSPSAFRSADDPNRKELRME